MIAKFSCSSLLAISSFQPSKFSLKLQKLIQEKLQKSEKHARTKINIKIRENIRRKINEIKIKYDKIKLSQEKMKQKVGKTVLPPNHFLKPLEAAGTGGAQKCRGSGPPTPNRHPNKPLCHAM